MVFIPPHRQLFDASEAGKIQFVRKCLQNGANPNFRDSEGETPLYLAIAMGHEDIVQLLLEAGASVRSVINTNDGTTALHEAAFTGSVRMLREIIARGGEINRKSESSDPEVHGRTPLIYSCLCSETGDTLGSTRLLLENGADANVADSEGKTALIHMIETLATRMSGAPFTEISNMSSLAEVVSSASSLYFNDSEYENEVEYAEVEGVSIASLLLEYGAKIELSDNHGNTALEYCEESNLVFLKELLLRVN